MSSASTRQADPSSLIAAQTLPEESANDSLRTHTATR